MLDLEPIAPLTLDIGIIIEKGEYPLISVAGPQMGVYGYSISVAKLD